MILIDAIYVNQGGAKVLLDLLIDRLINSKIKSYFLLDKRLSKSYPSIKENISFVTPSIFTRHYFYLKNKNKFTSILCFSNIPPSVNMNCTVHTFFQNVNLLNNKTIKDILKGFFIKYFQNNSFTLFLMNRPRYQTKKSKKVN